MANEVRLLVVEDNTADLEAWQRTIERHNATEEANIPAISLITADTLEAADKILDSSHVDAVVIDLRLDGNGKDPDNNSGNDVLGYVLSRKLAVTAIFTGQPADARVPEYARDQIAIFTKGGDDADGINAVMRWLTGQFPIIRCMQEATLTIRKEMASVFNRSIWPRWKFWMAAPEARSRSFLSASVARHIVTHVYESLSDALNGKAHAEEWYLLPPNPSGIRTGDLVRTTDDQIEIVVTPRCDIATKKYKTLQLARCDSISDEWNDVGAKINAAQEKVANLEGKDDKQALKLAKDELGKLIGKQSALVRHEGNRNAVHFLPRMKLSQEQSLGPFLVRFDHLRSIAKDDPEHLAIETDHRFATVAPDFLPSLVERLGAFFSRIGSPDYYHLDDSAVSPAQNEAGGE